MKIEAITLREIHMPLVHFFETSFGRTYGRRILLLTAHCDGVNGWSECVAGEDPFYSSEWTEAHGRDHPLSCAGRARTQVGLRPRLSASFSKVRGHRMAKAAVENALWDAEARQKSQPLWKLLGGKRKEIACGVSIGIQDSVEQLLDKIETELAAGYRRIKVKVKPGWDVNVLEKIRSRWADITLSCDANSAYTRAPTPGARRSHHHPHVHMIVPGGGISLDGQRWMSCQPGFFLPVRVLSRLFRRLFLEKLVAAHQPAA